MYSFFGRNLKNFLAIHANEEEYRGRIGCVLQGLADAELYKKWKKEEPEKRAEVCNLVYHIKKHSDYWAFGSFSWDLWAMEYVAIEDTSFDQEVIDEQLKIINLCLRGQYLWE